MSFTYDDQPCPARGPALTHMPEHRGGGRCEYCNAVVYSSERRDKGRPTANVAGGGTSLADERLVAYAVERQRIERESPDPLDRPSNAAHRERHA